LFQAERRSRALCLTWVTDERVMIPEHQPEGSYLSSLIALFTAVSSFLITALHRSARVVLRC
jgi:hypothetical protein